MKPAASIRHNLEFLQTEVVGQLESLKAYLHDTSPQAADKIFSRSGYLTSLKQRIHSDCFRHLAEFSQSDTPDALRIRGADLIASELERIAELGGDFAQQLIYFDDPGNINFPRLTRQIDLVIVAVGDVHAALYGNDTTRAVKIGNTQNTLERKFRKLLKKNAAALRDTSDAEHLLTVALSGYAIERMGDSLLRISEAIISSSLGRVMDTAGFQSMRASIGEMTNNERPEALKLSNVADTRSGASISRIELADGKDTPYPAILKQGLTKKLKMERRGVESWHDVFPGLAPQILAWKKKGRSASLLIEHLSGQTFEQIILNGPTERLRAALIELENTLHNVWTETLAGKPVNAAFMGQLDKRLGDIYAIHPEFRGHAKTICGHALPSFSAIMKKAAKIERDFPAPFSVYIHGDFNIDNVLYHAAQNQLHYVDLHRSRHMDYVQDVSVFMVSNYRLQVLDAAIRRRISGVIVQVCEIGRAFARQQSDSGFEIRLALGLIRSLATSTRFILDGELARGMFMRALYLLEQLTRMRPREYAGYRVPVQALFRG